MAGRRFAHLTRSLLTSDLRVCILVALSYYAGCVFGFLVRFPSSGIAYVWPPNAILLVSLLLVRRRTWPRILAAACVAHAVAHTLDGVPVLVWLVQFLGNSVQAVLAASVMLHFCARPSLCDDTLRSVTVFVGGAAVAASMIASLLPAYVYVKMGWASNYWSAWGMRTLTNVVTTVTLVPPVLSILGATRVLSGLTLARAGEFILVLLALSAVNVGAFAFAGAAQGGIPPLLYACIPLLAWASIRFGLPGLSICLLTLAFVSINTPLRSRSLGNGAGVEPIVAIQLFVAMWVSPLMFISAALAERRAARRTEAALQRSEAKNAAILRAIPDSMFVLTKDVEHRYVDYYTSNTADLLVPSQDFLGRRMRDVLPADLARSFEECFARSMTSGEPCVLEYSLPVRGRHRFYEARVVACDDDRLLSIVRDITERKQAEAALHAAQRAIARRSRASALGELSASIAHEVQQPLSAIANNAAACLRRLEQDAADSRQLAEALSDILDDSRRASDVISRTRELFSSGQRKDAPVELNAAIVEVLALTRDRAERSGESVRTELADAPLIVMGDRVQLQQVLMNLVVNGLDAMSGVTGPDRALLIQSWREQEFVHVAVRDAGPGFEPDEIDRIFDPFYTTKSDGLGIGLAISRSIVRAHGGTLEACRNPGGGATFEFTVPAAPETMAGTAAAN